MGTSVRYRIVLKKRAKKFIDRLPQNEKEWVVSQIEKLPDGDTKEMKGHKGLYRLRVGSYRILYNIDNGEYIIVVIDAGNRGEIYKRY